MITELFSFVILNEDVIVMNYTLDGLTMLYAFRNAG